MKKKKIIPVGTKVLLRLLPPEDKTYGESKIIIQTDKNIEHMDTGIIERIGKNAFQDMEDEFHIGDIVAFNRYTGKAMYKQGLQDSDYRVVDDLEIWCKIEEEEVVNE